jgi:glucose-fructose oxidoreductase
MAAATLRFPDGRLASFWSGFTSADIATYTLVGSKGHLRVDQAYEYHETVQSTLTIGDRITRRTHPMHDQFAAELVYFADCVRRRKDPVPSGEEGRADVAIIQALYRSAASGAPIRLDERAPSRRPEPSLAISRPPLRRKPSLVRVSSPHGD